MNEDDEWDCSRYHKVKSFAKQSVGKPPALNQDQPEELLKPVDKLTKGIKDKFLYMAMANYNLKRIS